MGPHANNFLNYRQTKYSHFFSTYWCFSGCPTLPSEFIHDQHCLRYLCLRPVLPVFLEYTSSDHGGGSIQSLHGSTSTREPGNPTTCRKHSAFSKHQNWRAFPGAESVPIQGSVCSCLVIGMLNPIYTPAIRRDIRRYCSALINLLRHTTTEPDATNNVMFMTCQTTFYFCRMKARLEHNLPQTQKT